jgi:hypothetical protein
MASSKFDFFKTVDKLLNQSPEKIINAKRALLEKYREENNKIVEKIWDIDRKLTGELKKDEQKNLIKERTTLDKKLAKEYDKKIEKLTDDIYILETSAYGCSNIKSSSPSSSSHPT